MPNTDAPVEKIGTTFHALTAGCTTILPDGNVITFGGPIRQVEGGTQVGNGTYTTTDDNEISWLKGLCKSPAPQIWEETLTESEVADIPANVTAGLVKEAEAVTQDITTSAERAIDPKIQALIDKAASVTKS